MKYFKRKKKTCFLHLLARVIMFLSCSFVCASVSWEVFNRFSTKLNQQCTIAQRWLRQILGSKVKGHGHGWVPYAGNSSLLVGLTVVEVWDSRVVLFAAGRTTGKLFTNLFQLRSRLKCVKGEDVCGKLRVRIPVYDWSLVTVTLNSVLKKG